MPIADRQRARYAPTTDAEKNQRAADLIGAEVAEAVRTMRRSAQRIQQLIDGAPGAKVAILALLGADQTEAATVETKILDLANTHKPTGESDLSIS